VVDVTSSTKSEAAARAAASTHPSVIELAALRLHDGVLQGRTELAEYGNVSPETWDELFARLDVLIDVLPKETPPQRGKTLRGGPPAFGRRERTA